MAVKPEGINSWLEEELYHQFLHDRTTVDERWKQLFEGSAPARPALPAAPAPQSVTGEVTPLRGAAARIAENMAASVSIPTATSQRTIAVKVMDENRRIINQHRSLAAQSKI